MKITKEYFVGDNGVVFCKVTHQKDDKTSSTNTTRTTCFHSNGCCNVSCPALKIDTNNNIIFNCVKR